MLPLTDGGGDGQRRLGLWVQDLGKCFFVIWMISHSMLTSHQLKCILSDGGGGRASRELHSHSDFPVSLLSLNFSLFKKGGIIRRHSQDSPLGVLSP